MAKACEVLGVDYLDFPVFRKPPFGEGKVSLAETAQGMKVVACPAATAGPPPPPPPPAPRYDHGPYIQPWLSSFWCIALWIEYCHWIWKHRISKYA